MDPEILGVWRYLQCRNTAIVRSIPEYIEAQILRVHEAPEKLALANATRYSQVWEYLHPCFGYGKAGVGIDQFTIVLVDS